MCKKYRKFHKKILIIPALIIISFFIVWLKFSIIPWTSFVPQFSHKNTAKSALNVISVTDNLKQTAYDCGAYNVAGFLSATGQNVKVSDIVKINNKSMIPRIGVVPEVLERTFSKYDVDSKIRTFRWMSDAKKEATVKYFLSNKKSIIALIHRHGYMHFVLITGFENDNVYIYDPMLNSDKNGVISGNDVLNFNEFIKLWNEVSVYGFYKNMAVIIEK